ncbi:MAG: hypothetical protein KAX57_14520 [Rhodoferax sp.]|nr:hypothetical protein [Rhodoferax sp.]
MSEPTMVASPCLSCLSSPLGPPVTSLRFGRLKTLLAEVRTGLSEWRQVARVQAIPSLEITRMSAIIQA